MTYSNGNSNGSVKDVADVADVELLALSSNLPDTVPDLLQTIARHGNDLLAQDPEARAKLLEAARSLTYALETPREAIIRHCWSESTSYAALETAVDINLFSALGTDDKPKTVAELAEATSVDPILLGRLMKHLAAMGTITETGYNEYCPTGFSKVLTVERYSDAFPLMTRRFTKGIMALPAFLKKNKYQNPSSPTDTAFQMGYETNMGFFGHVQQEPITAKQFNNHMSVYAQGRVRWMDTGFYPVQEQLVDGVTIGQDDVLLVDVGGSFGHDLSDFRRKWPGAPGRLVLQDLPEVVASVKDLHPSIEVTSHDFFTEQPVKGARAYYMHSVLHDWPDELCRKILANTVAAMRPGYSKLLVNENVIPDTGAYWETTSLDLIMMEIGSGERTERQWHVLLESAGLKIVKIWTAQRGVESLIECELA
ncbi:Winged helix-turn-helix transcription repressor DNA-binding [Penicillium cf. griseofulvum]|uniref:Winged helix-turn-helix transcription repressor DNA-binding n=1 Tax=Penicillium cf. griseofulvum TaxID=2972120 RepID=A0A9W9J3D2_9EURO|nr:Winged helix-turn-helix transcription repressor DNA-binding [Penicillium cf. griseofulvum]KAJ5434805.1 Winged helix-turn-helix transcription repressor DNA-binding [Penicillium cf. griseofulvum]KAJ5452638.1 Winged helix-turn-helix transcription repressor DNA-binding [Penicillium cf. griseofulvum]